MTEVNHELMTIGTAVAEHLDGFTAQPFMGHAVELVHTDGRRIFMRYKGYRDKNRLDLQGTYPTHKRRHVEPRVGRDLTDEISVAATKTPEQIAKDITRRLLPDYTEGYLNAQKQVVEKMAHESGRIVTAERLAEAMRSQPRHEDDESVLYDTGGPLSQVRITGPDSVRFEYFYCTADEAERVLQATRR